MIEKHLFLNICARMEHLFVNAAKTTLVQSKKLIILQLHESEFFILTTDQMSDVKINTLTSFKYS